MKRVQQRTRLTNLMIGKPVQYREVQGNDSRRFLSYFPHFTSLQGGAETGFQHVEPDDPLELNHIYQIAAVPPVSRRGTGTQVLLSSANITIRQVTPTAESLNKGEVFVLDRGTSVLQFNTRASSGKEKFAAAEFVRKLIDGRGGQAQLTVYDEGGSGASLFLSALGTDILPQKEGSGLRRPVSLYRLSDSSGTLVLDHVPSCTRSMLSSNDAFLVDASGLTEPAIFVWIGKHASLKERRLVLQYAQQYLYELKKKQGGDQVNAAVPIVRFTEGGESADFWEVLSE